MRPKFITMRSVQYEEQYVTETMQVMHSRLYCVYQCIYTESSTRILKETNTSQQYLMSGSWSGSLQNGK